LIDEALRRLATDSVRFGREKGSRRI